VLAEEEEAIQIMSHLVHTDLAVVVALVGKIIFQLLPGSYIQL
jgi:hypothetical protein